mmetsp:Transcript_29723/g.49929  ORF Transcript_29723/g.49929 Transcript_29723/m.49929 type:complete len:303 (-) Transcript_29723:580-1488(-)|eukprot:CAMPEP_0198197194 /NCGR_PEP_ID=MMETSP1445-20131203/790_1 /TAXON_ID=36898 /ORGANISM="Pyramimonas sp., Strain CCMP2087" /LENGTH=302 /DNA_ID=CAMNT_0043866393 /DNA_START=231 /DNA_END=1139 /DNA_ORIENTATION=+
MSFAFLCPVGSVRKNAIAKHDGENNQPSSKEMPFSQALKEQTQHVHDSSEGLAQAKMGLAFADPRVWVALLEQFGHVYAAIEDELMVNANDPHLSPLYDAFFHKLHRAEAFQQDIVYFGGQREGSARCKAVDEYIARIRHVAGTEPVLLLAYAQTMYMALLSGGQVIGRIQRTAMGLKPTDGGGAIFEFALVPTKQQAAFKKSFALALDALPLADDLKMRLIEEKRSIFPRNDQIIREVVANAPLGAYFSLARRFKYHIAAACIVPALAIVAFKQSNAQQYITAAAASAAAIFHSSDAERIE